MHEHRLAIDIGGTFTDVVLEHPDRSTISTKTLTTPGDPVQGAMSGITKVLSKSGITLERVGTVIHGTTSMQLALQNARDFAPDYPKGDLTPTLIEIHLFGNHLD